MIEAYFHVFKNQGAFFSVAGKFCFHITSTIPSETNNPGGL